MERTENIAWKTQLPGPGASSPITLGDKVFVTCYSGYGLDENEPGDLEHLQHHVLCIDRAQGKILWDKTVKARLPETSYKGFILRHGYASATPVTDGKALYVFFGHTGVFAYDLAGNQLWRADVGQRIHGWGSAASPILYKNLLIVNASVESGSLVALNTASGKEVWHAAGINMSWGTPLLVDLPGGRQELVVSVKDKVLGFEPASGERLWECDGVKDYICPSAIAHDGVVYITAGRKPESLAVRAGGRGDVSQSHVLWRNPENVEGGHADLLRRATPLDRQRRQGGLPGSRQRQPPVRREPGLQGPRRQGLRLAGLRRRQALRREPRRKRSRPRKR